MAEPSCSVLAPPPKTTGLVGGVLRNGYERVEPKARASRRALFMLKAASEPADNRSGFCSLLAIRSGGFRASAVLSGMGAVSPRFGFLV